MHKLIEKIYIGSSTGEDGGPNPPPPQTPAPPPPPQTPAPPPPQTPAPPPPQTPPPPATRPPQPESKYMIFTRYLVNFSTASLLVVSLYILYIVFRTLFILSFLVLHFYFSLVKVGHRFTILRGSEWRYL